MIKTFYKKRPEKKVFFTRNIKIRSHAYGTEVHKSFLDWRTRFLAAWNSSRTAFWPLENGSIDGNAAMMDKVGELRLATPTAAHRTIRKRSSGLTPLWFDGRYLEVGEYGELFVDGKETDTVLGTELKAWGATVIWNKSGQPTYYLFVFGKNERGAHQLRAYSIDDARTLELSLLCSLDLESTLGKKSYLYCFGQHIFFVSDSRLNYYYFNTDIPALEEVAIKTDTPNADKEICANVSGSVICDSAGYVYFRSGNGVTLFQIGYPSRVERIEFGERTELVGIQVLRDRLYVYCKSRITREYTCISYNVDKSGIYDASIFNRGSRYNLFYAEKNGILHYLKIPPHSRKAYAAKINSGNETLGAEIDISTADQMFCVAGDLYLDCSYVAKVQKD